MAQAIYCPACQVFYTAALRGSSCPACGEEMIRARFPSKITSSMTIIGRKKKMPTASRAVWDHIIKRDPCAYCGVKFCSPKQITIDHIMPKALGGSKGHWTNRTAACFDCNQKKAHTPLLHFMLEMQGVDLTHIKVRNDYGNYNWPKPPAAEAEAREKIENERADGDFADPRQVVLRHMFNPGDQPAPWPEQEAA
jgi:hypothetical protein